MQSLAYLQLPRLKALARNGIYALFAFVLLGAFHRRFWSDTLDPYKCHAMLDIGQWLDAPSARPAQSPFQKWQTPGCLLHEYNVDDIRECAGARSITFIGDTNTRQLFWATARKVHFDEANNVMRVADRHGHIEFEYNNVRLQFIWDPFLNTTELTQELKLYQEFGIRDSRKASLDRANVSAVLYVLGAGLSHARQYEVGAVRRFKAQVEKVVRYTTRTQNTAFDTRSPFIAGKEGVGDIVVFLPIEDPLYAILSPSRKASILPQEINQMNGYLHQLKPQDGLIVPWVYESMVSGKRWAYDESGVHVIDAVTARRADILLNMRCNAKLDRTVGAPFERTCCTSYRHLGLSQWILVIAGILLLGTQIQPLSRAPIGRNTLSERELLLRSAVGSLIGAAAYAYLTDRTQIFNKSNVLYIRNELALLCSLPFVIGALTIRKSRSAPSPRINTNNLHKERQCPPFLSDELIWEVRGWMAVVLALYSWSGAAVELRAYEISRVLIAAHLFLSGYTHALQYYSETLYTLQMLLVDLLRVNLLSVLLSYTQGTSLLNYHFGPLVGFWMVAAFLTFRTRPAWNIEPALVTAKVIACVSGVALWHNIPELVTIVVGLLGGPLHVQWDHNQWRRMISQDQYIFAVGMIVAALQLWLESFFRLPAQELPTRFHHMLRKHFSALKALGIVAAALSPIVWWILTARSPDEADYDWWHPMISSVPILSLVTLRNATASLRSYHVALLSWLGQRWLEIYILSRHIFSAADGRGVLSLGLWDGDGSVRRDRWRDIVLLVPLLLFLAYKAEAAAAVLARWLAGAEEESSDDEQLPVHDGGSTTWKHGRKHVKIEKPLGSPILGQWPLTWKDPRLRLPILLASFWGLNWLS